LLLKAPSRRIQEGYESASFRTSVVRDRRDAITLILRVRNVGIASRVLLRADHNYSICTKH
jgi:hypothetical protein